jgi:hypothetical protein
MHSELNIALSIEFLYEAGMFSIQYQMLNFQVKTHHSSIISPFYELFLTSD